MEAGPLKVLLRRFVVFFFFFFFNPDHPSVRNTASPFADGPESRNNKEQSVLLIPVDIGRTFPLLGFFQEDGPHHEQLRHVLEAYVCLRPDIGYVQGLFIFVL
jgi:hypothetical protein